MLNPGHLFDTRARAMWMWCVLGLLTMVATALFVTGGDLRGDSPLRMAVGGLCIFLLPGLYWGEALGVRARHPLETVALGFVMSAAIGMVLLPIPFLLESRITLWIWLLLFVTAMGMAVSAWRLWTRGYARFWRPCLVMPRGTMAERLLHIVLVLLPFALAVAAWRWGDDLFDISAEKMLHLMFVRYYHDLPLAIAKIGVEPGMPASNLVNLWEFWIAAWARCAGLDVLDIFFRARCVVPLLGLSGLYLLIRGVWPRARDASIVFALSAIMILGGAILRNPSTFNWVVALDSLHLRWATCFMATVQHADSAMDILLALGAGLALWAGRRPGLGRCVLLAAFAFICLLWHPREYFQVGLYAGVAGVTLLLCGPRRWRVLRQWWAVMGALVCAAVVFVVMTSMLIPGNGGGYDEVAIKRVALNYLGNAEAWGGIRSMFALPFHAMLSSSTTPEGYMTFAQWRSYIWTYAPEHSGWLFLMALALPALAIWGGAQGRRLAVFVFLLWFGVLAWDAGILIVTVLTYAEFYISTPRLLYVFYYLVVGGALLAMGRFRWPLVTCTGLAIAGLILGWWLRSGQPHARAVGIGLTWLAAAAAVWAIWQCRGANDRKRQAASRLWPGIVFLLALYFIPTAADTMAAKLAARRPTPDWYGVKNPFGLSPGLIDWVRQLKPGSRVMVDPEGSEYFFAYAPCYLVCSPVGTVIAHKELRQKLKIPGGLYGPRTDAAPGSDRIESQLTQTTPDFVSFRGVNYDGPGSLWLSDRASRWFVSYEDPVAREVVFASGASVEAPRVELRSVAEVLFPIVLPSLPLACEALEGVGGMIHGWVNVGWRGAVSVQGVEDQPGVMLLVAGGAGPERGESCRHCLLLQPAATGDQGLAIVPEAQFVEFECNLRSETPVATDRLLLRLDRRTESGWTYAAFDRWVKVEERWTSYRVKVYLGDKVKGIRPILEWYPGAEGATLELRTPRLHWYKVVNSAYATMPTPTVE